MKTSKFRLLTVVVFSFGMAIVSCSKNTSSSSTTSATSATSVQTAADDQTMVTNENDAVTNDATVALNSSSSISGSSSVNAVGKSNSGSTLGSGVLGYVICDATITFDTTSSTKTITIVYNGSNCLGNRTRTGTVIISVPQGQKWTNQGASVNVQIDSLKITRIRDGKTIIINGSKTITNTSGGLLVDLSGNLESIVHNFTDTMSITFDNGTTRSWMASKQYTYTYNDGVLLSVTGTHNDGTNNNVSAWGTNRFGVNFENLITSPKIYAQSCSSQLVSGEDSVIRTDNITSSITYGLTSTGSAITACPSLGNYLYAELVWSNGNNGKVYTYIYPY